ncbi:pectinesterase family protein [Hymenobacter ruricola]|uniref:T9SS type A sorting domain-containing protein n=1 Tax=Hymenobacter ruricola TaxID=2791023 RepID=A0ABS0I4F9_9BACT|nr:pectinesterase family protein [Hymenobacter ruricola]MBF9221812.1 T9SS type A sorting domain-containing protein [Hymenobacter ruricola]
MRHSYRTQFTWPRPAARFWALLAFLLLAVGSQAFAFDVTVAQDGTGNFTTVQAAINAAPTGRTTVYTIFIKNGRYREKINIPANKPFLQLVGESVANTILTYDDGASTLVGGVALGTQNSASFSVNAPDFSALNITFENAFGDGSQAVAVLLNADHAVFKNCRFLGNQDTLYVKGSGTPMHYFRDCYIDGNVDFIFGSSVDVFDRCVVYAKSRAAAGASYITAANTPPGQAYGFIFHDAKLPANTGATLYYLGRPWQNSTGSAPLAQNKVVLIKPTLGFNQIQPAGWTTWDAGTDVSLITYGEFRPKYFSGRNVNTTPRVAWSRQLAVADTAQYQTSTVFGTWNPCAVASNVCTAFTPDIAVSNFRATKGATQTTLDWNISWAMAGIRYDLLRSTDNVTYTPINTVTATNDSTYNFQMTDVLPTPGNVYYYKVQASKAGLATHTTLPATVSSVATIVTNTAALGAFAQYQTGTSAVQTYSLSATNLTANLTVTPPAGYEISANGGTTWFGSASPLVLAPTANTVAATTISVRLNAATAGLYAGNIVHTSTAAAPQNVAVTGSKVNTPAPVSDPVKWWSLKVSDQDSAAIRAAGTPASAPTFRRFVLSNGTTATAYPARSTRYGQAFAPTADGLWGTAAPTNGPGSSVSRRHYEQFTITAPPTAGVRVDSVLLWSAFYNTTGKLAVAYSKSNFVSDSTDVTGGRGPAGVLPGTANGAFATPIALANQNTSPNQTYRFALNNASGTTLSPGQTLTVRLYFACASSSSGRYALLKDVVLKGQSGLISASRAARNGMSLSVYPNPTAGKATVELAGFRQAATLTVLNALGQVVQQQPLAGTGAPVLLDVSHLAKGVYLLRVANADATLTQRLVRE